MLGFATLALAIIYLFVYLLESAHDNTNKSSTVDSDNYRDTTKVN